MPHSVHSTQSDVEMPGSASLDYWNVNVPPEERTKECPEWLKDVQFRDREMLSTPDSMYKRQSWGTVCELVGRSFTYSRGESEAFKP